jgi:endonuclease YncB( thermonuclease family)
MRQLVAAALLLIVVSGQSSAEGNPYLTEDVSYEGPFRATVVRVIDADTIEVNVELWPDLLQTATIRVRGIDAPEARSTCESEKALGLEAKEWVEKMYPVGEVIRVEDVEHDSLSRYVADVKRWRSDRWLPLANELLERDFAEIWYPGQQDVPWCLIAQERAAQP